LARATQVHPILPKRFKDDDIGYARKFHKTFQKGKSTNDR